LVLGKEGKTKRKTKTLVGFTIGIGKVILQLDWLNEGTLKGLEYLFRALLELGGFGNPNGLGLLGFKQVRRDKAFPEVLGASPYSRTLAEGALFEFSRW